MLLEDPSGGFFGNPFGQGGGSRFNDGCFCCEIVNRLPFLSSFSLSFFLFLYVSISFSHRLFLSVGPSMCLSRSFSLSVTPLVIHFALSRKTFNYPTYLCALQCPSPPTPESPLRPLILPPSSLSPPPYPHPTLPPPHSSLARKAIEFQTRECLELDIRGQPITAVAVRAALTLL